MRRQSKPKGAAPTTAHLLQPNAAGVDVGANEIYVAVPADRDPHAVWRFRTFTADLRAAAEWLRQCGIASVAMESTSVCWIPFFQILEAAGSRSSWSTPATSRTCRAASRTSLIVSGCSACTR
jgi:transposase